MQHPLHCFERGDVNRSFIGAGAQQIHGSKVQSGVQEHAVPHRCELSCSQAEALEKAQAGLLDNNSARFQQLGSKAHLASAQQHMKGCTVP